MFLVAHAEPEPEERGLLCRTGYCLTNVYSNLMSNGIDMIKRFVNQIRNCYIHL